MYSEKFHSDSETDSYKFFDLTNPPKSIEPINEPPQQRFDTPELPESDAIDGKQLPEPAQSKDIYKYFNERYIKYANDHMFRTYKMIPGTEDKSASEWFAQTAVIAILHLTPQRWLYLHNIGKEAKNNPENKKEEEKKVWPRYMRLFDYFTKSHDDTNKEEVEDLKKGPIGHLYQLEKFDDIDEFIKYFINGDETKRIQDIICNEFKTNKRKKPVDEAKNDGKKHSDIRTAKFIMEIVNSIFEPCIVNGVKLKEKKDKDDDEKEKKKMFQIFSAYFLELSKLPLYNLNGNLKNLEKLKKKTEEDDIALLTDPKHYQARLLLLLVYATKKLNKYTGKDYNKFDIALKLGGMIIESEKSRSKVSLSPHPFVQDLMIQTDSEKDPSNECEQQSMPFSGKNMFAGDITLYLSGSLI